jgi:hypothetical protein
MSAVWFHATPLKECAKQCVLSERTRVSNVELHERAIKLAVLVVVPFRSDLPPAVSNRLLPIHFLRVDHDIPAAAVSPEEENRPLPRKTFREPFMLHRGTRERLPPYCRYRVYIVHAPAHWRWRCVCNGELTRAVDTATGRKANRVLRALS